MLSRCDDELISRIGMWLRSDVCWGLKEARRRTFSSSGLSSLMPNAEVMCPQVDADYLWPPDNLIGSFEDRLGVNGYLHNVADDDAALVHLVVPTHAELLPID